MPPDNVIGTNIARIRADREMSQARLAEAADISRVALGKIERGDTSPRPRTLTEIAKGLDVPLSKLVTPVRPLDGVRFRARKRVNTREQILAEVSTWLSDYTWLENELSAHAEFKLGEFVGSGLKPRKLAAEVRRALGLSPSEPIHDICGLLEESGVKVRQIRKANDSFFGLSVSAEGGGPAVVVNTWERISVERWIYTAAHELGHLLLHSNSYHVDSDEEIEGEEKDADRFAGYLLLPEEGFDSEWNETSGLPLIERVLKVKRIFHVSYKAVLYRLVESGREKGSVWPRFQVAHKRRFGDTLRKQDEPQRLHPHEFDWNRAAEPDRLSEFDFIHDRLFRLVRKAYEEDIISFGRAAEILDVSRSEMRELADEWAT